MHFWSNLRLHTVIDAEGGWTEDWLCDYFICFIRDNLKTKPQLSPPKRNSSLYYLLTLVVFFFFSQIKVQGQVRFLQKKMQHLSFTFFLFMSASSGNDRHSRYLKNCQFYTFISYFRRDRLQRMGVVRVERG